MTENEDIANEAALVLFSGGQDSATCLAWALARYARVETIGFAYGQRHGVELQARQRVRAKIGAIAPGWAERLGEDVEVDLSGYGGLSDTALTAEREFEIDRKGLPTSFVPARNLVFLTVAAAHAYRRGASVLVAGVCQTDYSGYPDCRSETIEAQERAISLGLGESMRIDTPLMHLTKAETWTLAASLGDDALIDLIEEETHSCYRGERGTRHDWGYGCANCPACELREKGWREWREGAAR
ncbi:MAG: 7-cyano-7-deazaguanine synthase QueC [Pseudomonadota bacterium]